MKIFRVEENKKLIVEIDKAYSQDNVNIHPKIKNSPYVLCNLQLKNVIKFKIKIFIHY